MTVNSAGCVCRYPPLQCPVPNCYIPRSSDLPFSGKILVPITLPCPQRAHWSEIINIDSTEVDYKRSTSICKHNQISLTKNTNICSYYLPYLGQNASPESVMRNLLKTKYEITLAINNLVQHSDDIKSSTIKCIINTDNLYYFNTKQG
jgi:hypothetical protein